LLTRVGSPEGLRYNRCGDPMRTLALFFALALLMPAFAHAQAVGAIAGVVTDESGAVMPGVTV
jgi:hypothetical protein